MQIYTNVPNPRPFAHAKAKLLALPANTLRQSKTPRMSKAGRQSKAADVANLNLYINLTPLGENIQC